MPNSLSEVAAGAPNLETYDDNGDGTVTDRVTGLMWQQAPAPTMFTLGDAGEYCRALDLGGHDDWRVPTLIELISIVDDEPAQGRPRINATYFPATPLHRFWTLTVAAAMPTIQWLVEFYGGSPEDDIDATGMNDVRCVRTAINMGVTGARYTIAAGTVYDVNTRLMWQQSPPPTKYIWADANAYCQALGATLGGVGWRLPTMKELLTIVDYSRFDPAIDLAVFPATQSTSFWSARNAGYPTAVWGVNFGTGSIYNYTFSPDHILLARCVH